MGRHSAGPAPDADSSSAPDADPSSAPGPVDGPPAAVAPRERAHRRLLDRVALAVVAAAGTGFVMAWAGAQPAAYVLGAGGTVVAVLVAAQLASTVPGPPPARTDPDDGAVSHEP